MLPNRGGWGPLNIIGTVRGRGRKANGQCKTHIFTEGNVMYRRGMMRKLKNIIIEYYSELNRMAADCLNGFDPSYHEIFNEFLNIKAIYLNKEQRKNLSTN